MPRGRLLTKALRPQLSAQRCPAWGPLGAALLQHWRREAQVSKPELEPLLYWSNLRPGEPEPLPAAIFFRRPSEMPALERHALELCLRQKGTVLDLGAGAGSHVLALTSRGMEAEGMDVCPEAVEVMRLRGVTAHQGSFWKIQGRYDSLLLLMNTAGASGSMLRLEQLLRQLRGHVTPQGQVLLDLSPPDWAAIHRARRLGRLPAESCLDGHWAELTCWLSLGQLQGHSFPMLFAEVPAVVRAAEAAGYKAEIAFQAKNRHALLQLRVAGDSAKEAKGASRKEGRALSARFPREKRFRPRPKLGFSRHRHTMSFLAKVLGLTFLAAPAPQHGRHLTSRLSTGPEPSAGAGSFGSFGAAHAAVVCGGGLLLSAKSRPRRFGSGGSLGSLRRLRRLPVQRAEAEAKATGTKEMPKALVVNLDRSPARWESAKEEFSREGLTVERFSGTDGRALSHADLRKVATWSARWFCTKGMLGCFLSHRRIWQKVVDEKLRAVIVLEDDVRLVKDFNNRLLKLLDELPDDWEVCLLGAVGNINSDVEPFHMKLYSFCVGGGRPSPGKTRKISPGVFVPHRPAGTHAYMVSQKGAQRLLKDLPKACYHVDLTAWALPDLKLYCAVDQLATQDFDAESTVSKAGQSRTQRFLKWSWAVTGLADMGKKGGVPNPEWAWKAAMFAIPVPLSGGKRIAVELGPTSAAWVVLLLTAALRRSKTLLAIAIMYQGTGGAICRYLANTRPYLFFLAHCALAAASLHFLP